jgi:hypothetical protein
MVVLLGAWAGAEALPLGLDACREVVKLASRGMANLATGVGEVEHEAGLGVTQLRPAQNQA